MTKFLAIWISLFLASSLLFGAKNVEAFDIRTAKLSRFLKSHNSPFADKADAFVNYADANGLDYRLLASISGMESTFGQHYLPGTFNAYGWGGGVIAYASWEEGIGKISQALKEKYAAKGAVEVEDIARIYCPPNSANWARNVRFFMDKIDNTDPADPATNSLDLTL